MSERTQAILFQARCELEALITRRESIVAANRQSPGGEPYGPHYFDELERMIRAIAPDPTMFSDLENSQEIQR